MRVNDFHRTHTYILPTTRIPCSKNTKRERRESVRHFFLMRTRPQICGTTNVQSHQILAALETSLHALRAAAHGSDKSEYPVTTKPKPNHPNHQPNHAKQRQNHGPWFGNGVDGFVRPSVEGLLLFMCCPDVSRCFCICVRARLVGACVRLFVCLCS